MLPGAMVDTSVCSAVVYEKFQFERNGYFSVDPDTKPGQVRSLLLWSASSVSCLPLSSTAESV